MAEESSMQFLHRRRRELLAQVSALKGQLSPKEAELAQIDRMLAAIEPSTDALAGGLPQANSNALVQDYVSALQPFLHNLDGFRDQLKTLSDSGFAEKLKEAVTISPETIAAVKEALEQVYQPVLTDQKFANMTIKELIIQALIDHFPNGGTLAQIRDFIRDGYGRQIEAASLRPQAHRLKADGVLGQDPTTDTWNFIDGKRQIYRMYNHPTSRKAMKELQDDANAAAEELRAKEREPDRGGRAAVIKPHQDDFLG